MLSQHSWLTGCCFCTHTTHVVSELLVLRVLLLCVTGSCIMQPGVSHHCCCPLVWALWRPAARRELMLPGAGACWVLP